MSMKNLLVVLCISLSFTILKAQERIIELKPDSSSVKLQQVPFDKIIVLDNRIDTSNVGIVQTGGFNKLTMVYYDKPVATAIQKYIEIQIDDSRREAKRLVININRLKVFEKTFALSERGYIDIAMDAYIPKG
jgi:hypothetical protein